MKKWKLLLNIVTVVGPGALSGQSWAGCYISYGTTNIRDVTLPDISISATATVGTLLATVNVPNVPVLSSPIVTCDAAAYGALKYGTSRTLKAGGSLPADVYEVKTTDNVDSGIGVRVSSTNYLSQPATPAGTWYQWMIGGTSVYARFDGVKIEFYKTGPIIPGELQFPANFIEGWLSTQIYSYSASRAAHFDIINISNAPKVKIPTCETPNLTVNLGKHAKTDFGGIGSTSSETPFDFALNNCSPDMTAVKFTFKPAAGITLENSGTAAQHLSLKSGSTASGVGIQVLYQDGTLIPFNTANDITLRSEYNASTGGTFTVPMKARYIQTASTIQGGTANSAVEFTMTYE